jgi:hypothetical protein
MQELRSGGSLLPQFCPDIGYLAVRAERAVRTAFIQEGSGNDD